MGERPFSFSAERRRAALPCDRGVHNESIIDLLQPLSPGVKSCVTNQNASAQPPNNENVFESNLYDINIAV